MKQLVSIIINQIEKQIKSNEINMLRLESFDDPRIYSAICDTLSKDTNIDLFLAKLTKEKYDQFKEAKNEIWEQSLQQLNKGCNDSYSDVHIPYYDDKSYVDFNQAITKWRNESPNLPKNKTSLIMLMGTEAAPDDSGSLKDTTFIISPREIIDWLKKDYSECFSNVLKNNAIDCEESRKAIDTFYKVLFANINIDIFKLCDFVDEINNVEFKTCQDLIEYICETLNKVWNIPSVLDPNSIPKINKLSTGKTSSAKIISDSYNFITRTDDIPTNSAIKKLNEKFDVYASEKGIIVNNPFPENSAVFTNYDEFRDCIIRFMKGIDIENNREKLLLIDYSIISEIIGTKLPKKQSTKSVLVTGEPFVAYAKMLFNTCNQFKQKNDMFPLEYIVEVEKVQISDCGEDIESKTSAYKKICDFMGGMLDFLSEYIIEFNDSIIDFKYKNNMDPFDFNNVEEFNSVLKSTGKWGDPYKIHFKIKAISENKEHIYEYKWAFSPYSPWLNAFSYMVAAINKNYSTGTSIPSLVLCNNIQDYLQCESEEEFYSQLNQINYKILDKEYSLEIKDYFKDSDTRVLEIFDTLTMHFESFADKMNGNGFFKSLSELRTVVKTYSDLMDEVKNNYAKFNNVQKEKLSLVVNCFLISSNESVVEDGDIGEAIVPAYNPAMLEKIDAKQLFLREGFANLMSLYMNDSYSYTKIESDFESIIQLSTITQGLDVLIKKSNKYITCKNMWEYYGVYYSDNDSQETISSNTFSNTIITEDEDAPAMLKSTPISNIVVRNILDYINTFPSRLDGLNVSFIAPLDMQHIVSATHTVAKKLDASKTAATINLKIISMNSKKNSATYLKKWLDSYFDESKNVKVNTFLINVTILNNSDIERLEPILENCDLCFNYDILDSGDVEFDIAKDEKIDINQAKFPMSFVPDTIPATHGKVRKVSLSQFQFLASKKNTQASYKITAPHSIDNTYRAYKKLELEKVKECIIEQSHNLCRWVVCIDPAIDRKILENSKNKIIGFTTGEGNYGELNVTVSARKDILDDIKRMMKYRVKEKFISWDDRRLQKAVDYCIDDLSSYMDGSRILKALNPYDYEIHSFLAYLLTLQTLEMTKQKDDYIIRSLISLDSYKHWFEENDDNKRPDFMLIEIPKTSSNLNETSKLKINIKIIECKMASECDNYDKHIGKAKTQLEKGLRCMCKNWNPNSKSIMQRYWFNQLYRAIIFSPINMDDSTEEYKIIRDKIYGILNGNFEIEWTGDIFAFWLYGDEDELIEDDIDSEVIDDLIDSGIDIRSAVCHQYGQLYIQKMLLPPDNRTESFKFDDVVLDDDVNDIEDEETEADKIDNIQAVEKAEDNIPASKMVYVPFLHFLSDGADHSRRNALSWFSDCFNISHDDKKILYESNNHPKWETVLDRVITDLRKSNLLENTLIGNFHLTDKGKDFYNKLIDMPDDLPFAKMLEWYNNSLKSDNNIIETKNESVSTVINNDNIEENKSINSNDTLSNEMTKKELSSVRLLLGEDIKSKEKYYWEFGNKNLNNRHLLINGNSGCGKTYCIQALLMESALQGVSSVVFDYTGGFTSSKLDPLFKEALGDRIKQRVIRLDKIPVNPFIKHDIQIDEDLFVPETDVDVASKLAETFASVYSFGDQQKSAIYSAIFAGLKANGDAMSFNKMVEELENVGTQYAKTVLSKIQAFTDINPFAVDKDFSWGDIRDSEGTVYVIQLTGYGRDIQILLTEILLWDIWNFSVKTGDESKPFILVLDEAQNLSHGPKSPSAKILTEGRKFGISGWYATQFMKPQLSDDEIQRLQQAGQKLYFCPPDDGVITVAKNIDITPQGSKTWMEKLKKLKKGECVTCGNMVRNSKWSKYDPHIIKVTSLQERLKND